MRTRTHLTTPPGQEPELSAPSRSGEAYVPGLAIPEEPHVPGRYRRLWVALGLVVVLALVVDRLVRHRGDVPTWVVGTVTLLPGAWLVHVGHIFAPEGVAGMGLIGVGSASWAWRLRSAERAPLGG